MYYMLYWVCSSTTTQGMYEHVLQIFFFFFKRLLQIGLHVAHQDRLTTVCKTNENRNGVYYSTDINVKV